MNANKQIPTMYETTPVVAGLNKVPGFNPLRCLRRTKSSFSDAEVLKLDLRYKKLWFRLAYPAGRLKVIIHRITEQLAIIEAKVYLDKNDSEPVANFTVQRTANDTPGGLYIQAAQHEAMDAALNDAGFGLQFSDVSTAPGEEVYGSEIPLTAADGSVTPISSSPVTSGQQPVSIQTTGKKEIIAESIKEENGESSAASPAQNVLPDTSTANENTATAAVIEDTVAAATTIAAETELPAENLPITESGNEQPVTANTGNAPISISDHANWQASENSNLFSSDEIPTATPPSELTQTQVTQAENAQDNQQSEIIPIDTPRYSKETPVADLLAAMTYEEAGNVYVDVGTCKGLTMKTVAERRPPSLKWFTNGYTGDNNILRAAAHIMLDPAAAKKAG